MFGDEDFLDEAFATLPPSGTVERDAEAITALAAERGVQLRSLTTLRKEVRRRRPAYERTSVPGDLVVARTAVSIAVEFGSEVAMPIATVLAHVETGRTLAVRLSDPQIVEKLAIASQGILRQLQKIIGTALANVVRRGDRRIGVSDLRDAVDDWSIAKNYLSDNPFENA